MIKKIKLATLAAGIILVLSCFVSLASAFPLQAAAAVKSGNTYVNQSTGTISFSGYTWYAENTGSGTFDPGPNHFSSSSNNVWVDSNGWLHVQLTHVKNAWYCVNLNTVQALGYGTYSYVISNNAATLDRNTVLGLFAYKDDSHEVDIELSTWGARTGNNLWFTVQPGPYTLGYNQQSFNAKLTGSYSTHFFTWTTSKVFFESLQGAPSITSPPPSSVVGSFTSPVSVDSTGVVGMINLWLLNGHAPTNGQTVAVVIKSFNFTPAST